MQPIETTAENTEEKENQTMKIKINDTEYNVILQKNKTVDDLLKMLPLNLEMQRYAGHEYYASLEKTPYNDSDYGTSYIKANGVYYWDGWNAFVINYEDSDITPYKPVYIGNIDGDISQLLKTTDNVIDVTITNE